MRKIYKIKKREENISGKKKEKIRYAWRGVKREMFCSF